MYWCTGLTLCQGEGLLSGGLGGRRARWRCTQQRRQAAADDGGRLPQARQAPQLAAAEQRPGVVPQQLPRLQARCVALPADARLYRVRV